MIQAYQNDPNTAVLHGSLISKASNDERPLYGLKSPILLNKLALLVSSKDVARLSKTEINCNIPNIETPSATERNTMLKLIIGMAIDAFG